MDRVKCNIFDLDVCDIRTEMKQNTLVSTLIEK